MKMGGNYTRFFGPGGGAVLGGRRVEQFFLLLDIKKTKTNITYDTPLKEKKTRKIGEGPGKSKIFCMFWSDFS